MKSIDKLKDKVAARFRKSRDNPERTSRLVDICRKGFGFNYFDTLQFWQEATGGEAAEFDELMRDADEGGS